MYLLTLSIPFGKGIPMQYPNGNRVMAITIEFSNGQLEMDPIRYLLTKR